MSGPRIIGLTGYARSGKDTVAKILAPYGFVRVAFADAVREMAFAIDPILWEQIDGKAVRLAEVVADIGWERAKAYNEVRRLLQVIGTEAVRNIVGPSTWIDIGLSKAVAILDDQALNERVVITDVRFPNEADAIRELGGQIWRVRRPGVAVSPTNAHSSELEVGRIRSDATIDNDAGFDSLERRVLAQLGNHDCDCASFGYSRCVP